MVDQDGGKNGDEEADNDLLADVLGLDSVASASLAASGGEGGGGVSLPGSPLSESLADSFDYGVGSDGFGESGDVYSYTSDSSSSDEDGSDRLVGSARRKRQQERLEETDLQVCCACVVCVCGECRKKTNVLLVWFGWSVLARELWSSFGFFPYTFASVCSTAHTYFSIGLGF